MRKKVSQPASRGKTSVGTREGDYMREIPAASASLSEFELDCSRKKDVYKRIVGLNLKRVISKVEKTPVSLPDSVVNEQRRLEPVIIHTIPPRVIRTDPSEFMWVVQRLTGSARTRSRCKKNGPPRCRDPISIAQADTAQLADDSEHTGRSIANSIAFKEPESRGSSDDEESVSTEFVNSSSESASGFSTSPTVTTESVQLEITDAGSSSPRGPLRLSDWVYSGLLTEDRNFTSIFPSLFDSSYISNLDLAEHFAVPISEPIPESLVFPVLSCRDVDYFTSINDITSLQSFSEDGFTL